MFVVQYKTAALSILPGYFGRMKRFLFFSIKDMLKCCVSIQLCGICDPTTLFRDWKGVWLDFTSEMLFAFV